MVSCTHPDRGRVLKGRLVVDALLMTGIHSVLEDEAGDVVKVGFSSINAHG